MAKIELRDSLFGGVTGTVKGNDLGLSWADSQALQSMAVHSREAAMSAWETSQETRRARHALEAIDYSIDAVAEGVASLEASIGLKLEQQAEVLHSQAQILDEIRGAVLTPAKTRAAERLADASTLLRSHRYERALTVAQEGIEADPTNPGGFFAAGWALVGLQRFPEAQETFEEARDASEGDERSRAARQAARAAFVADRDAVAYQLVRDARSMARSDDERAAVDYDVAVYAWANGEADAAREALEAACRHDSRYCQMALADRALAGAQPLRDLAAAVLAELAERLGQLRLELAPRLVATRAKVPELPAGFPPYGSLLAGLRPPDDAEEARAGLVAVIDTAEEEVRTASGAPTLQAGYGCLETAAGRLDDADQAVIVVAAQIEEQVEAGAEQREEERLHTAAEAAFRQYGGYMVRANWILARKRGFFWSGGLLLLLGLAVSAAAVLGVLVLAVPALAFGVYTWAEPQREAANAVNARFAKLR